MAIIAFSFSDVYCGMLQLFVSLQTNLFLCWHGYCHVNVTLSNSMKNRTSMNGRGSFHGIGRCACRFHANGGVTTAGGVTITPVQTPQHLQHPLG